MERPGVVWFGEALPAGAWEPAADAVRQSNVLLVVGTSAVVYPAAFLIPLAQSVGAKVIEVNIERTGVSGKVDSSMQGPAGELLPLLLL
jgi:NAD-dependent deacetylase